MKKVCLQENSESSLSSESVKLVSHDFEKLCYTKELVSKSVSQKHSSWCIPGKIIWTYEHVRISEKKTKKILLQEQKNCDFVEQQNVVSIQKNFVRLSWN